MKKQLIIIETNCINVKQIKQLESLGLKVIVKLINTATNKGVIYGNLKAVR